MRPTYCAGHGLSSVFPRDMDCGNPQRWTVVTRLRAVPNTKGGSSHCIIRRLAGSDMPFNPSTCPPFVSEPRFLTVILPDQNIVKLQASIPRSIGQVIGTEDGTEKVTPLRILRLWDGSIPELIPDPGEPLQMKPSQRRHAIVDQSRAPSMHLPSR